MALLSWMTYRGQANGSVAVWTDLPLINWTQWNIHSQLHLSCSEAEEATHVSNLPN